MNVRLFVKRMLSIFRKKEEPISQEMLEYCRKDAEDTATLFHRKEK